MLTLRALLDAPHSGLHLISARPDQLDREIPAAFLTDLPDPSAFLSEGMMVLSSGIWARVDGGIETFVAALEKAGVGSLVLGLVDLGVLPEQVIQACRGTDIPLIVTDDNVLYSEIARQIEDAADPEGAALLASALDFSRSISSLPSVNDVLSAFHATFAVSAVLIQRGGLLIRPVGAGLSPETAATATLDLERFLAPTLAVEVNGQEWVMTPLARDAVDEGILAISLSGPISGGMSIAVATACVVLRALTLHENAALAAQRAAVADLLTPGLEISAVEMATRFRIAGGEPGQRVAAVYASVNSSAPAPATVLALISRAFSLDPIPIARLEQQGVSAIIRLGGRPEELDEARRRLEQHAVVLGGRTLRVGVSDSFVDLGRLPPALSEARIRHDSLVGTGVLLAAASSGENHHALLAGLPEESLADFSRAMLASLQDYDVRTDAHLVETITQFLAHLGRWQDAAQALHVHPNTLRYRIRRVEALTGRSLGDITSWVDFQLALDRLNRQ